MIPNIKKLAFGRISAWQLRLEDVSFGIGITNTLKQSKEVSKYAWRWALGDIEYMADLDIVVGKLGKFKEEVSETVYDSKMKSFPEIRVRGGADVAFFLIHAKSNIIAYQVSSDISAETFLKRFNEVLMESGQVIEINPITEEGTGFIDFARNKTITRVSMRVVRPNPKGKPHYDGVIEELNRTNTDVLKDERIGGDGGLNIDPETLLGQCAAMEEDGYAAIIAETIDNQRYQSDEHSILLPLEESPESLAELLNIILNKIKKLFGKS